jgi:sodium transport system permease protein
MHNIKVVFLKELLDTIRDRRTIISMIVVPMFIFPILTLGLSSVVMHMEQKSAEEIHKIAVIGKQYAPRLYEMIDTASVIRLIDINYDSLTYAIDNNFLQAAMVIPEDFQQRIEGFDTAAITIVYNEAESRSKFASDKLYNIADSYRKSIIENRLIDRGIAPAIIQPFKVNYDNIAKEKMGSFILSMLIPYVIIILSLIGAMYTAIDLTAGEKERGTLETILVSPIPRWHLATGKFLAILTVSIISTILVLTGMLLNMYFGLMSSPEVAKALGVRITPVMIFVIFLLMIPTAAMLSALLMSIALFAKSYKEAQSYISPLMFLIIIPAFVSFLPGVDLNFTLAMIPIVNISLCIKNALMGHIDWLYLIPIFLSTLVYAAAAIFIAHRLFEKESVLFRS